MSDDQLAIVKIESSEESKEEEDAIEDSGDKEGGDAKKTDERDPNAEYMILHKVRQEARRSINHKMSVRIQLDEEVKVWR